MTLTIQLLPESEERLRARAVQAGYDVESLAAKLLDDALLFDDLDSPDATAGIQRGLDDFENGRYRRFEEFADEQRRKYGLPQ